MTLRITPKTALALSLSLIALPVFAQTQQTPAGAKATQTKAPATQTQPPQLTKEQLAEVQRLLAEKQKQSDSIHKAETDGVKVRLGDIGKFRGARSNVIQGVGLVVAGRRQVRRALGGRQRKRPREKFLDAQPVMGRQRHCITET